MKYDDASWHYGGDFPKDLPNSAGATHSGMFLAWALLQGMGGELTPEETQPLRDRKVSPGMFLMETCDGKFVSDLLNEEGNAFASAYFEFDKGKYVVDYEALLAKDLPTIYHVEDSWQTFEKLKPTIDRRYQEWKTAPEPQTPPAPKKPWWKLR